MGYSITIPLKKKIDREQYISLLDETPYHQLNTYLRAGEDYEDFSYVVKCKNAIYCDFKALNEAEKYYLLFFASQLAIKHGLKKTCKKNNKMYPYFYYDHEVTYVIPKEDEKDFDPTAYEKFRIHVNDKIEDINIHAHLKNKKFDMSEKEFNEFFGDNNLLKENCKKLFELLDAI